MVVLQKLKDWHLILMSVGIISIEVLFTIPLLTLTYVNGDSIIIRDSENPAFINVSVQLMRLMMIMAHERTNDLQITVHIILPRFNLEEGSIEY